MSKYEKLGSFLLFEKLEEDKLSKNYLAGQIVNNEIKSIHLMKKFDHSLSTMPDLILDLNEEFEVLKGLANPNIVKPTSFVQDKSEFAAIFEYVEGKSLRAVLNKCVSDGYPFTADHALLISSRLCTALEYLHSKKVNDERLVHGFVCPETIIVSYDGEIKLQYLALARALLKFPAGKDKFFHDYKNYLAPELLSQGKLDKQADVFGAGLVLYEMLTGDAFLAKGRNVSVNDLVNQAQMHTNSGERTDIPEEIRKILYQSLAMDAPQRYPSIGDMRKALDLLLFSSEFSPTTFNLAFFMHSLFRENIDEESKNIANYKKTDVASFIKEEPPPAPPKVEPPVGAAIAKDLSANPAGTGRSAEPSFGATDMFGAETKEKSKMPLIIGGVIVLLVAAVLGLFFMGKKEPQPAQNAAVQGGMTSEQQKVASEEKARLEQQAKAAEDEAKKKDEELQALQAKLDLILKQQKAQQDQAKNSTTTAGTTPAVDPKEIQKLQEQAKKLEEQRKAKEEEAAKLKEAAAAPPAPPPVEPSGTTTPAGGDATKTASANIPTSLPPSGNTEPPITGDTGQPAQPAVEPAVQATKEGDLVELSADVMKPEVLTKTSPQYPSVASAKRIEGTVILSLLINERGDVSDVKVLRGAGGSSGLNEAASAAVRKWKFRPAVKDGKRVKVWMTYPIVFKLQ